jgi:hypothetical protein
MCKPAFAGGDRFFVAPTDRNQNAALSREELTMTLKLLAALAALPFVACTGTVPSSDKDTVVGTDSGTVTDTNVTNPPEHSGGLRAMAFYPWNTDTNVPTKVVDQDGNVLGNTDTDIDNLPVGPITIWATNHPEMTTLGGEPFQLDTDDVDEATFYLASRDDEIIEDTIVPMYLIFEEAPQYFCESKGCDYPYTDSGTCTLRIDSETQWIYVEDGILHGSTSDAFGGAGAYTVMPKGNSIDVTSADPVVEIISSWLDDDLSFGYISSNTVGEISFMVSCSLRP